MGECLIAGNFQKTTEQTSSVDDFAISLDQEPSGIGVQS